MQAAPGDRGQNVDKPWNDPDMLWNGLELSWKDSKKAWTGAPQEPAKLAVQGRDGRSSISAHMS